MTITFEEVKQTYIDLLELLERKKQVLIKKDIEELNRIDERLICIYNDIKTLGVHKDEFSFSQTQKDELNTLSEKINEAQKDNEVLIMHSLSVIDKIFEGILNITSPKNGDYNHLGKKNQGQDLEISSITEEA